MRILLTNDDGINAPGLYVLEKIAAKLSDDIWICAPSEEQSGAGHSLTLTRPVRLREHASKRFSVTGTPTDSVAMALKKVLPGPPDLVLSGVNRGANLGDDVTYSGTVAAAFESALAGIRSIALSPVQPTSWPRSWSKIPGSHARPCCHSACASWMYSSESSTVSCGDHCSCADTAGSRARASSWCAARGVTSRSSLAPQRTRGDGTDIDGQAIERASATPGIRPQHQRRS